MKKITALALLMVTTQQAYTQGCVAIRSGINACTTEHADHDKPGTKPQNWQLSLGYRYFKSFRHFSGPDEQKERVEKQTDVRNWQHSFDISLFRRITNRTSVSLGLPLIANLRSSMYEHYGNNSTSANARNTTSSFGLGDLRLGAYRWMIDPAKMGKGNIQLGAGLKLPSGDYRYQDYFHKNDSTRLLGPVDQSIQLGDGGTGIFLEANAYYFVNRLVSLYGSAYYMSNPRDHNGVSTGRGSAPNATAIKYRSDVMSVPDQYMLRGGVNLKTGQFSTSIGARIEGIPAEDLIGKKQWISQTWKNFRCRTRS